MIKYLLQFDYRLEYNSPGYLNHQDALVDKVGCTSASLSFRKKIYVIQLKLFLWIILKKASIYLQ